MSRPRSTRPAANALRAHAVLAVLVLFVSPVALLVAPAQGSTAGVTGLSGSGSTWSANAINQWTANIATSGLKVNYSSSGSSAGRSAFSENTVDFAVSEIPYGVQDGGTVENISQRPFAYMPIVAGGTSFMYNLSIGGVRVESLRLSGENVAKLFTGVITQWNDPAIQADNPGLTLPATRVVPVVRSDGSGSSAQFTQWMLAEHPAIWQAFCAKVGRNPCTQTSNYPAPPGSSFQAKALSNGVTTFVTQSQADGAITYVEYSYAKEAGFPVAKVLNQAGYYILPKAENVAVGLLGAQIETANTDPRVYLTQKLGGVYRNSDPRAYPLSSYSYMILPTALDGKFSQAKANTLAAFAEYFLCAGQAQADPLGYSPLPLNLVQAGLEQVRKIPGVTADIDLSRCNNPTFSASGENLLALNAPQPAACDQRGPLQCGTAAEGTAGAGGAGGAAGQPGSPATAGDGSGGSTGGGGPGAGTGAVDAQGQPPVDVAAAGEVALADPAVSAAAVTDPATGLAVDLDGDGIPDAVGATDGVTAGGAAAGAIPLQLASTGGWQPSYTFVLLTVLTLLGVILLPPLMSRRFAAARR